MKQEKRFSPVLACLWLCAALLVPSRAQAQSTANIPPELGAWIPWVLADDPDRFCPTVEGNANCVWPGRLSLELYASGGRFRINFVTDREIDVALPGAAGQWPFAVRTAAGPLSVVDTGGVPTVRLPKGGTDIDGQFIWNKLPDTLVLPERIALVHLELNGRAVERPRRDPNLLWLASSQAAPRNEEEVSIEVFRRLEVGSPLLVRTWLELTASGKSREVNLGNACLADGTPLELITDLPARLEPDHTLVVQLVAGTHHVKLLQALPGNTPELFRPALKAPWPEFEVWSLLPNDALRQLRLEGGVAVDAERSNVPADWRGQASYRIEADSHITLVTERRGDPNPAPNRLTIRRDLWLDMDGSGFTARDEIDAVVNQGTRLDLGHGELGQVRIDNQPQLVTLSPASGLPGVELRKGNVKLQADWRQATSSTQLSAVAWSSNADSLSVNVHLPPGFDLLGATGVDHLSRSWLASWDLFALFYVLLVGLVAAKLGHPVWGALGILVLTLIHDQPDAPEYVWLALLAAIAVLRVLPLGLFRRLAAGLAASAALTLVVLLVNFGISQVRQALYPQVSHDASIEVTRSEHGFGAKDEAADTSGSLEKSREYVASAPEAGGRAEDKAEAKAPAQAEAPPAGDPKEVIQTGPGIPNWNFKSWELGWSGPVHEQHGVRLYLLTPAVTAVLAFLRVGLCGLFAWLLLRLAFEHARRPARSSAPPNVHLPGAAGAVALAIAFGASGLLLARPAAAELPDTALLEELKRRVTAPAPCQPNCLSAGRAKLEVKNDRLSLRIDVAALVPGSFQLPGPAKEWAPTDVRIDGRPTSGLVLGADGFIYVRLEPGPQTLDLTGAIPSDSVSLKFGARPQRLDVDAPGWEVSGLREEGQVSDNVTLHRRLSGDQPQDADLAATSGWLVVRRTFRLGTNWTVDTQIDRIAPNTSATARIRLLPFERVTSDSIQVEDGVAVVTLDRGSESISFRSTLKQQTEFTLKADAGQPLSERWAFDCSPIWHCTFQGLEPTQRQAEGLLRAEFAPEPGEELQVNAVRPASAPGETFTVDSATLEVTPGLRLEQSTLTALVRASAQHPFSVQLPKGAQLQQMTVDGAAQSLVTSLDKITLQLAPGEHQVVVGWQRESDMGLLFHSPKVHIDSVVANARTSVALPEGRWLLLTGGAGWGPAILFWGFLALLVVIAPVLGRAPGSPLKSRQWLALLLGLTQIPTIASLVIVGWFFALAHVNRWRSQRRGWHNATQLLLVWWTGAFLSCLLTAVYDGLLSSPDMAVQGGGSSSSQLIWYLDRTLGDLPESWVVSASLWVYRFAMLAWALWLSSALVRWLSWAWGQFASGGLWLKQTPTPPKGPLPVVSGGTPEQTPRNAWGSVFYPTGFPKSGAADADPPTLRRDTPPPPVSEAPVSSLLAPTHLTFPELFVVQQPTITSVPSSGDEDRHTLPHTGLNPVPLPTTEDAPLRPAVTVVKLPEDAVPASAVESTPPVSTAPADVVPATEAVPSTELPPAGPVADPAELPPETPAETPSQAPPSSKSDPDAT